MKNTKTEKKTNPAMAPTVWIGALVNAAASLKKDTSLRGNQSQANQPKRLEPLGAVAAR
jgi:hypothetical protein